MGTEICGCARSSCEIVALSEIFCGKVWLEWCQLNFEKWKAQNIFALKWFCQQLKVFVVPLTTASLFSKRPSRNGFWAILWDSGCVSLCHSNYANEIDVRWISWEFAFGVRGFTTLVPTGRNSKSHRLQLLLLWCLQDLLLSQCVWLVRLVWKKMSQRRCCWKSLTAAAEQSTRWF